jgi:hypothetical protein
MAKTTGTRSLLDLIKSGVLRAGDELVINRRSAAPIRGTLQADGSIMVGKVVGNSPSTAARQALNVGSIDGWLRWRVVRLGEKTLAEVRDQ